MPPMSGYTKEISEAQIKILGEDYAPGDVVGSSGLEADYETTLRGRKGAELTVVNVRGQVIGRFEGGKSDVQAVQGDNLLCRWISACRLRGIADDRTARRRRGR